MRGSSCARPQAAVPAVSENHPPVDRLLGGQHCGWLSEIRSEVSAPARLCPRNVDAIWGAFVPTDSWFGRAELRTMAFFPSNGLGYGGLCPHPPRNLRFLGFSICCRLFGRRTLRTRAQAQAATTAAQRRRLAPETHPSSRAATSAALPASPMRGSSCARPQAACRPFGRRALRTRAQAQAATTAAQRRRLAPTLHQKRTPADKRRPPARSPRRLNATAIGSGHCPRATAFKKWYNGTV